MKIKNNHKRSFFLIPYVCLRFQTEMPLIIRRKKNLSWRWWWSSSSSFQDFNHHMHFFLFSFFYPFLSSSNWIRSFLWPSSIETRERGEKTSMMTFLFFSPCWRWNGATRRRRKKIFRLIYSISSYFRFSHMKFDWNKKSRFKKKFQN